MQAFISEILQKIPIEELDQIIKERRKIESKKVKQYKIEDKITEYLIKNVVPYKRNLI